MKVVSLELAKELKEKGYNGSVSFYYWRRGDREWQLDPAKNLYTEDKAIIEAPTADEILDELPDVWFGNWLTMTKTSDGKFELGYAAPEGFVEGHISGNTLVEAAAKMWLYLK